MHLSVPEPATTEQAQAAKYPYVHGRSNGSNLACFQMLSQHLGMPFRRDVLKRALANFFERSGSISALWCDRGVDGIKLAG